MNLQLGQPQFQDNEHLQYLLDYSDIAQSRSYQHLHDFSISKDKLNMSEKERTRDESYEDICKLINQAKLEQVQLNQQLQQLKQHTFATYLGPFRSEFQQLNQQNLALRAELNHSRRKTKDDKNQRLSNRSSIKPKTSKNSIYRDENAKTHSKAARKQASPNLILKKNQKRTTESSANLGKSQIVSPRLHRRRESQLTERRMQQNNSVGISVNASYYEQKDYSQNGKENMNNRYHKKEDENQNIFVQILQKILIEEKIRDKQRYYELYLQVNEKKQTQKVKQQVVFINQLQEQIETTNEKLQMLTIVLNKYQSQIGGMNVNLKNVEELTRKLYSVKGRFVEAQKRCSELVSLRKEVSQKQQFLNRRKEALVIEDSQANNKNISSVETLIKIITNNHNKSFKIKPSSLYYNYYHEVKGIFKENTQEQVRRNQKMVKVREMIENIRQGRKKFNELIQIYQSRIAKLQEKIAKAKGHHLFRSDKSSRK